LATRWNVCSGDAAPTVVVSLTRAKGPVAAAVCVLSIIELRSWALVGVWGGGGGSWDDEWWIDSMMKGGTCYKSKQALDIGMERNGTEWNGLMLCSSATFVAKRANDSWKMR
jgi:hypothetical protein